MTLFGTGNGAPQDTQSDVFAVTERIGEGASAVVYRARHTTLGIDVALKIWRRGLTERQRVRFLSECRLHWRLSDHPNVVRMLWADVRQDGCPWIASELYTESLADRLAERGPLPLSEALHLADGLLRGLAAMHHEGLVHRDVKPANVMLDGDRAALGDFGTAMASTDMTEDRAAGTSRYVAPELLGGASPSARSDVYSAGVTIRETIGAQPTPAVAAVLVRATSYLPDDRPENAEQLRRALTAAGGLATDRADVGPVAGAGSGAGGGAAPWTAGAAARPRRGRRTSSRMRGAGLAVLAVSLVSAAALAVTLLVALPRDDGTPSSTPAGAPPADIPGRLVAWGAGGDEAVAAVDAGQTGQVGQAGRSWSPRPVTGPWADAARVAGAAVVSTAGDRACAVDGNGRLACWSADGSSRPEQPPLPESPALFADVDVGGESACGIDDQAELWCWGGPGSPDPTLATPATRVVGGPWQEVSVGDTHTCAVTMTGRLACWGDNRLWQLGGQETPGTTSPVFVHTLRTWRLVSAGPDFTCGIATDGLFCWGVDLVVRATEERVEARRPPTRIEDGAWATVSAGRAHACAVAEDGVLFCWGDDSQGQLSPRGSGGDGGQPGTVPTAPWRAVSAGGDSTCGVMVDGTLWCWGSGGTRQVGAGTRWADVEVAARHACAGAEDGTVACWDVTVDSTSGSGDAVAGDAVTGDAGVLRIPIDVGEDRDWVSVAAGGRTSCGVRATGTLWCWGRNDALVPTGTAVVPGQAPAQVAADVDWAVVSAGEEHMCALDGDGALWCWGENSAGQVGNGNSEPSRSPVSVRPGESWRRVGTGGRTTCAIDAGQQLWCWGAGEDGQIGDGARSDRPSPVRVTGERWTDVGVGVATVCAVRVDRTLWCWGAGGNGQVGDGARTDRDRPVRVDGAGWRSVAVGRDSACAVRTDDTAWCWGLGDVGQLGDGGTRSATAPVQVRGDGWERVAVGRAFACGVTTDAQVECWGDNGTGELGDGATGRRGLPGPVDVGAVSDLAVGGSQLTAVLAVVADGGPG